MVLHYSSQSQRTALHYASEGGHHDTVRVLLERGADPNTRDKVSGTCVDIFIVRTSVYSSNDKVWGSPGLMNVQLPTSH